MRIEPEGHWGGSVAVAVGRLVVHADTQAEAKDLAVLTRFLRGRPRAALAELAAFVEGYEAAERTWDLPAGPGVDLAASC